MSDEGPGAYTVPGTPVPARLSLPLPPLVPIISLFLIPAPDAAVYYVFSILSVSAPRYIESSLHGAKESYMRTSVLQSEKEQLDTNLKKSFIFSLEEIELKQMCLNCYSSLCFKCVLFNNFKASFNHQETTQRRNLKKDVKKDTAC